MMNTQTEPDDRDRERVITISSMSDTDHSALVTHESGAPMLAPHAFIADNVQSGTYRLTRSLI